MVEPTGSGAGSRVIAPLLAGVIAAGSLINSGGFISDNALGYSEGLATALALIAVDSYMDGARQRAFVFGFFAALDRPELWFFWGPYGLYLFWRDPGARKLVVGLFALIPVLWFLPELWGSGHLLRGVTRAQHPRANSAAFAKCPVCTVFKKEAWPTVLNRVKIPGIIALFVAAFGLFRSRAAWWRHSGPADRGIRARAWLLGLGVFGLVWWLGIAFETQAGFSGNDRYLVLGTAPVAIVGGVAWGWFSRTLADWVRRLAGLLGSGFRRLTAPAFTLSAGVVVAVALFLAVPPWIGTNIISLPRTHHALVYQAHLREDLTAAVQKAGGKDALLGCGAVMTEGFQVPMVAWTLGVRTLRVEAEPSNLAGPPWPAVILQTRAQSNVDVAADPAADRRLGARRRQLQADRARRTFRVFSTCAGKVTSSGRQRSAARDPAGHRRARAELLQRVPVWASTAAILVILTASRRTSGPVHHRAVLGGRGDHHRDRLALAERDPGDHAPRRLAAAVLPDAACVDQRFRRQRGRDALAVAVVRAAVHPRRHVGRLEPVRAARRPVRGRPVRVQHVPHRVRAGDADVRVDGAARHPRDRGVHPRLRLPAKALPDHVRDLPRR